MNLVECMLENKISSSEMLCNPDHTITKKFDDYVSYDVEWKCGPHIFQRNLCYETNDVADIRSCCNGENRPVQFKC